ncbi:beta-1-4-N-acetylgalactosaminyltransferase bre-4-like [Brachionus plicatilis]|uniref:Beta-1,4-galactosyltransferase n=1 Tax=Brachionus plicatilis TaxID=10195 RepID=A0A3M7T8B2_BRAPC|nr:beta-1-4-N-acetylgalactosaminyltransferase bre-4-like [Brachionus plicatilis]
MRLRIRRLRFKNKIYFTIAANFFLIFLVLYHEKIFNAFDFVNVAPNYELCRQLPFKIADKSLNLQKITLEQIENELGFLSLQNGVKQLPDTEKFRNKKVAIIVPYRDRVKNLHIFLLYMHKFLSKQNIEYKIYLLEPLGHLTFNRALLLNVGYLEVLKEDNKWDCFIFHDVDMLPENGKNMYDCHPEFPKQMAVSINTYAYSTEGYFKEKYFGGVNAFTKEQFRKINGFSNLYYGWGIEDDDARYRVLANFPKIARLNPEIGRYFANCHELQPKNPNRFLLYISSSSRIRTDGLNSVHYKIIQIEKNTLFTRFYVKYSNETFDLI